MRKRSYTIDCDSMDEFQMVTLYLTVIDGRPARIPSKNQKDKVRIVSNQ